MEPKTPRRVSVTQFVILSYLARSRDGVLSLVRLKNVLGPMMKIRDRTIEASAQALTKDALIRKISTGRQGSAVDLMISDEGRSRMEEILPLAVYDSEMLLALRMVHKCDTLYQMRGIAQRAGFPINKIMRLLDEAYACGFVTADRVKLTGDGVSHLATLKERHEMLSEVLK